MSKTHFGPGLAAALLAGVAAGVAAPACAETLADALALAYQTNPNLLAQLATQRSIDENYVQARAGYRPTLNFTGNASDLQTRTPAAARGQPIDTTGNGAPNAIGAGIAYFYEGFIGLDLAQPIWTGGRVAATVSAAEGDILAGRENVRRTESQVMLSTIQAYLDVRRDQEGVRIRELNVGVLHDQLKETQARFDVGELTRT